VAAKGGGAAEHGWATSPGIADVHAGGWRAPETVRGRGGSPGRDSSVSDGQRVQVGCTLVRMRKAQLLRVLLVLGAAVLVATAWRSLGGSSEVLRDASLAPAVASRGEATLSGVGWGDVSEAPRGATRAPLHEAPLASPTTAPDGPSSDAPPAIRGVIVDEFGAPLADTNVTAEHDVWSGFQNWSIVFPGVDAFAATRTSEDGRFVLQLPTPALATVRAAREGRVPTIARGVPPEAELRLVLTPAATLEGDVLDAQGRTPVADALVRVMHGDDLDELTVVRTDGVGHFRAEGLTAGMVVVIAAPDTHVASRQLEVDVIPGATVRVEVLVEAGRAVAGIVRDAVTLDPLEGARVSTWDFLGKTVVTDGQGRFRIDGVALFAGTLAADAVGYSRAELSFGAGVPTDEALELEVALSRAVRLAGRIVDTHLAPIPGAVAVATGRQSVDGTDRREWREAVAGEDGRFVIEGARADIALDVQARAPGFGARSFAAPVPDAEGVVAFGDLVLAPQATIGGQVVDHLGMPVPHANVGLNRIGAVGTGFDVNWRSASCDRAGRFFFAGLDGGMVGVRASASDGRAAGREVTLRSGEQVHDLVIALPGGETLRGRVIDASTKVGLADALVVLSRGDGTAYERRSARSDEAGEFELEAVSAGEWVVHASLDQDDDGAGEPRYGSLRRDSVVADGTYLELPLSRLDATLRGCVLDARDAPVAQCFVARLADGEPAQDSGTLTDAEGRFTLQVPSGGPVELAAYATETIRGNDNITVLDYHMGRRVLLAAGPIARGTAAADMNEVTLRLAPE
jgi:hypothetical protein